MLPSKISFGAGIGKPRKWFLGFDYTLLEASKFSNRFVEIENSTFEDASVYLLVVFSFQNMILLVVIGNVSFLEQVFVLKIPDLLLIMNQLMNLAYLLV